MMGATVKHDSWEESSCRLHRQQFGRRASQMLGRLNKRSLVVICSRLDEKLHRDGIVFPFFVKVIMGAAWLHTQGLGFGHGIAESFPITARLFSGEAEWKLISLVKLDRTNTWLCISDWRPRKETKCDYPSTQTPPHTYTPIRKAAPGLALAATSSVARGNSCTAPWAPDKRPRGNDGPAANIRRRDAAATSVGQPGPQRTPVHWTQEWEDQGVWGWGEEGGLVLLGLEENTSKSLPASLLTRLSHGTWHQRCACLNPPPLSSWAPQPWPRPLTPFLAAWPLTLHHDVPTVFFFIIYLLLFFAAQSLSTWDFAP